jgi:hypothetical protein
MISQLFEGSILHIVTRGDFNKSANILKYRTCLTNFLGGHRHNTPKLAGSGKQGSWSFQNVLFIYNLWDS